MPCCIRWQPELSGITVRRMPSKGVTTKFGKQTEEVLAEFGFTRDEIASLKQAKVVS
jgi:crotonobetainyl-CoA:carnitine CoA-transferase CaiB-like acyl-CoA transferase